MAAPTALLVEARRLERRRVALVIEPPVRVWLPRGDRVPRPTLTYAQLGDRIEEWHRLLDEKRLTAGSVVALRGDYSPEICALFLAIVLHRRAVVGLPQGEDIGQHLGAAHAEALFDFTNPGRWSYMSLSPAPPPSVLRDLRDRGAAGLLVFTSGTTGQDKAALFVFDALVNPYRKARPGYRTQVFLLLDHLGGIHTMLHTLAHGEEGK